MKAIETGQGRLRGLARQGVTEFRGIPFARPPLGPFRFRAPQPPEPWSGVYEAHHWPEPAVQQASPLLGLEHSSEDCLYLNVWVPEGDGPFPVMLWFHGGGYISGSPSQLLYNGEQLARAQQVIVVNAGYRLGVLGYGWFSEIAPELAPDSNLGLRDQVAALRWVYDNMAAFGGDPDNITIFGESAGGFSVATLLAVPRARPLFRRAICQSGAADYVLAPEEAARVTSTVVDALPGEGTAAARMQAAGPEAWARAQTAGQRQLVQRGLRATTPQFGMAFMPVVDGDVLPEPPLTAIARGDARDKPLMAGVCRDEWHLFQYAPPFNGNRSLDELRQLTDEDLAHRFRRALPLHGDQAFALYHNHVTPDPRRAPVDVFSALESDRLFRVPTLRLLDAQQAAGGDTHGFQFTHEVEAFGVSLGACHVVDVPLVFGLTETPVGKLFTGGGDAAARLARRVMGTWAGFARGERPDWPDWRGRRLQCLGPADDQVPMLDAEREDFWRAVIPEPETANADPGAGAVE
jgi:para-nitrobenzyl esterase